jgi:hypothetical protein
VTCEREAAEDSHSTPPVTKKEFDTTRKKRGVRGGFLRIQNFVVLKQYRHAVQNVEGGGCCDSASVRGGELLPRYASCSFNHVHLLDELEVVLVYD